METAIAVVLSALRWVWSHLQGGWLVALVLLGLISSNAGQAAEIARLRGAVEELQEAAEGKGNENTADPDDG
jgi:hypothetical protein